MNQTVKRMLTLGVALILFYVTASVLATITQLAAVADRIHVGAGQPVFWLLLGTVVVLVGAPIALFIRLPKALVAPPDESEPAYSAYQKSLGQHLKSHPKFKAANWPEAAPNSWALSQLGEDADKCIRGTASGIFLSTALMQNGRLDGMMMFAAQLHLVWKVASIYHLRPSPRQILYLYSNVGAAMLVATNIDDVDFAELTSPIVAAVVPSISGAVPGLQGIAGLLVNSLASGAANAFLTLRVGLIAKEYCAPLLEPSVSTVRKSATKAALQMLADITKESGSKVAKGVWTASTVAVKKAAIESYQAVKTTSSKVLKKTWGFGANTGYQVKSMSIQMSDVVVDTSKGVRNRLVTVGDTVWDKAVAVVKAPSKLLRRQNIKRPDDGMGN